MGSAVNQVASLWSPGAAWMELLLGGKTDTPSPPPAPSIPLPEVAAPIEPDKAVSKTNAGITEEKRRILAALPKATKTILANDGNQGVVTKKTLLGSGSAGSTTLG